MYNLAITKYRQNKVYNIDYLSRYLVIVGNENILGDSMPPIEQKGFSVFIQIYDA